MYNFDKKPVAAKPMAQKPMEKKISFPEKAAMSPTPARKVNAMKTMMANPKMAMAEKKPMLAKSTPVKLA